jgi:hypothetical protein
MSKMYDVWDEKLGKLSFCKKKKDYSMISP